VGKDLQSNGVKVVFLIESRSIAYRANMVRIPWRKELSSQLFDLDAYIEDEQPSDASIQPMVSDKSPVDDDFDFPFSHMDSNVPFLASNEDEDDTEAGALEEKQPGEADDEGKQRDDSDAEILENEEYFDSISGNADEQLDDQTMSDGITSNVQSTIGAHGGPTQAAGDKSKKIFSPIVEHEGQGVLQGIGNASNASSSDQPRRSERMPKKKVIFSPIAIEFGNISLQQSMKKDPVSTEMALREEVTQLIQRGTFIPIRKRDIGTAILLPTIVVMQEKSTGLKSRIVANGAHQNPDFLRHEDISSPTMRCQSMMILIAIAACLEYEITAWDVKGAYLQAALPVTENIVVRFSKAMRQARSYRNCYQAWNWTDWAAPTENWSKPFMDFGKVAVYGTQR
jgi:hypothetical protein